MLSGTIQRGVPGARGFDANTPIGRDAAAQFHARGYRFCLRYVGRTEMASHDLTAREAESILDAGLALMPVQHVLDPGWQPTGNLGGTYGENAARFARQIGFPPGVNVWCDLECVSPGASPQDVVDYCSQWYAAVAEAGYVPGLYVGYEPGLSGGQLYGALKFQHYWAAYNVDGVSRPDPRGWQMIQSVGSGTIGGITTEAYDANVLQDDGKGGQVLWLQR
jgi:hypothetical protein